MYTILTKEQLNAQVVRMVIAAPLVAKRAQPGQFVMLRVGEWGERFPLTIAGYDRQAGSVTIIFQTVGKSTTLLAALEAGDSVTDVVGPLGQPSHLANLKKVCVIGGGLGCAIAYPQAKALHEMGAEVHIIGGFRNKEIIILEEEMNAAATAVHLCTDDGSNGRKALVTDVLKQLIEEGHMFDAVIAIGPLIMMKFVCLTTKPYGIKTYVSMNPIMVDGTGMCGCCRVSVDGEMKFACVDGPDFDGHKIDFDEAMRRNAIYKERETKALHACQLGGGLHG